MAFQLVDKIHTGSDLDRKYTRQGEDFMDPKFGSGTGPMGHADRPGNLVRFLNCRGILLQGVTIQNSPTWTIQFSHCEDVSVEGLNINSLGSGRRIGNDDGIDLVESANIRISGCHIQTGDDCIAVFGSRNMVVSNCTLAARSAGIRVGYDSGETRNCVFEDLTIDSNCGLKVNVRGSGSVEDVIFSNIIMRTRLITGHWWGKGEPVNVSCLPLRTSRELGHIRRIRFSNILAESENSALVFGSPDSPIEDVMFDNFDLRLTNSQLQPSYGGNFDLRGAADLAMALFKHDVPALYLRHVRRLRVAGFRATWGDETPAFFSHAIEAEDFEDVEIRDFEGRQANAANVAAIALRRGNGISIRDCRAAAGCGTFLSQTGVSGQGLFVNNDLSRSMRAFEPLRHGFTDSGNLLPKRS
jgi:parallel beta-helix repeat protein